MAFLFDLSVPLAAADLAKGIEAFEQRRWMASIREFIDVLKHDPRNTQAHEYLALAISSWRLKDARASATRRLEIMETVSTRLENNRQDATELRAAISETTQAESNAREERFHAQCELAKAEDHLGHWPAANDLVLRVLSEDANNAEAQRLLSDLQSQIHEKLELSADLSAPEREALEGFYAYGQADYRTALAAWSKTRAALEAAYPPADAVIQVTAYHLRTTRKSRRRMWMRKTAQPIRRIFLRKGWTSPETFLCGRAGPFPPGRAHQPRLPATGDLSGPIRGGRRKRTHAPLNPGKTRPRFRSFARGLAALEKNQYPEARQAFQEVLAQDPTHPQARSYLDVVESEMNRRYDPHAAQLHYEAGLVDYASGKLDDAMRNGGSRRGSIPRTKRRPARSVKCRRKSRETWKSRDRPSDKVEVTV